MKTSKEYFNNLKNGILTSEMLYDCIYSANKRAKNNRDGKNYYGKSFLYFLLYEMPQGTFHSPIDETEIRDYKHLEIERIDDDFYTYGENFEELISVQFVKKVIKLAKENKLKYIEKN